MFAGAHRGVFARIPRGTGEGPCNSRRTSRCRVKYIIDDPRSTGGVRARHGETISSRSAFLRKKYRVEVPATGFSNRYFRLGPTGFGTGNGRTHYSCWKTFEFRWIRSWKNDYCLRIFSTRRNQRNTCVDQFRIIATT